MIPLEESRYARQEVELMREADEQHHPNIARLFVSTKDHQFHYVAFSSFDTTLWQVLHCLALVHSVRRKELNLTSFWKDVLLLLIVNDNIFMRNVL